MSDRFRDIQQTNEFKKDFKKLKKRFPSLEDDLQVFIETQLHMFHKLDLDNQGIKTITVVRGGEKRVYKARKFACRSLKGRGVFSGIRVVYAYDKDADVIHLVEIYFKGDKQNENRARIARFLKP